MTPIFFNRELKKIPPIQGIQISNIHRVKFHLLHLHRFKSLAMNFFLIGIIRTVGENVYVLLVRMPVLHPRYHLQPL